MPLGSSHAVAVTGPRKLYRALFGTEDFHTHLRWDAIEGWVNPDASRTLEVGAQSGVMTVALARMVRGQLVSSEFDQTTLAIARRVVEAHGLTNVELGQDDLRTLSAGAGFDQALVIDVLEHIDDHEMALKQLAAALNPGGRLIISVPTPRYPEVFGRAFHNHIGHVRDGYWLRDLEPLLTAAGFDVADHHYYTGPIASWVCRRWYRNPHRAPAPMLAVGPALRFAARLGERRPMGENNAASLALLAIRR